jgi:hypothetical protein
MSNDVDEKNYCGAWIEEAIAKKHIKYYEYEHFNNIQEIGSGGFAKVYRANWKNSNSYFALKSLDKTSAKEIVNEVIMVIFSVIIYIYTKILFLV